MISKSDPEKWKSARADSRGDPGNRWRPQHGSSNGKNGPIGPI